MVVPMENKNLPSRCLWFSGGKQEYKIFSQKIFNVCKCQVSGKDHAYLAL